MLKKDLGIWITDNLSLEKHINKITGYLSTAEKYKNGIQISE